MKIADDKKLKEFLNHIEKCRETRDIDGIFQYANELYKLADKNKNMKYKGIGLYHLSNCNYIRGNYIEAKNGILKCLQLFAIDSDVFYHIMAYNLAGIVFGIIGDEVTSVNYMLKAYYMSLEKHESSYIYIILNNLGVLFMNLKYYDIALTYLLDSFESRKKETNGELRLNDGINILNIYGCYVHLQMEKEKKQWKALLEAYRNQFHEETVESDFALYQVFEAFYHDSSDMEKKLDYFLKLASQNADYLHTVKDEIQLFDLCIKKQNRKYCEIFLHNIHTILEEHPFYQKASVWNELKIRFYQTFHMEEAFHKELTTYYEIKEKEKEENDKIIKQTLQTKIELEKALYHQSEIIKTNEELRKNIELEEFTMLLNKSSFRKYVEKELEHLHTDQYVCLIIVDIDKFKEVNDTYGHLYGDKVLLKVVEILKSHVRTTDYIGRIGGDEFCVFMKNILSLDYLSELLDKLMLELNHIHLEDGKEFSASIGVCVTNQNISYDTMFNCADERMYEKKHNTKKMELLYVSENHETK